MMKTIFKIGVILLFAFFIIALVRDSPLSYGKTNQNIESVTGQLHDLSYNGQSYMVIGYNYSIQANAGDIIELTVLGYSNNGVWATVFFEQSDGTPIFAYKTVTNYPATYSMKVGTPSLTHNGAPNVLPSNQGGGSTTYLIQLGVTQQEMTNQTWNNGVEAGIYKITANVYSNSIHLAYVVTAILFLIAGVITTLLGYFLNPKNLDSDRTIKPDSTSTRMALGCRVTFKGNLLVKVSRIFLFYQFDKYLRFFNNNL